MLDSKLPVCQFQPSATSASLIRLAKLIAIGRDSFPLDLPADELSQLQRLVQRYRRERLLKLIATVVAADIKATRKNSEGGQSQ